MNQEIHNKFKFRDIAITEHRLEWHGLGKL